MTNGVLYLCQTGAVRAIPFLIWSAFCACGGAVVGARYQWVGFRVRRSPRD